MEESGIKLSADGADAFIRAMDNAAKAMQDFAQAGENASRTQFDPDTSGVDGAKGKVGEFDESVKKTSKSVSDHAGRMNAAIAGAVAAISNALINAAVEVGKAGFNFIKDGVKAAGDLEQKLSVLQVTSSATDAQMEAVRKTSIALGADMTLPGTSASDATDAMLELAKAGFTVDQAMEAAQGTLQLATAAQVDAATAAQMSAGALQAFELPASKAGYVADLLANGANASSASMSDLSDGLKQGGFAFHAAGMSIDDLVSSIAILTNVGLTGSDAGTALKNAMIRLMSPTKDARKVMEEYGLSFYDAQGKMKPLEDIIGILNDKLGFLTDEQRNSALETLFLSDGMKAMIPLMTQGEVGFDKMKQAVNKQGAAQELAAAQMKGFNGAMAAVQNVIDTLALTIGGVLLPVLTDFINNVVAPAASKILEFATAFAAAQDKIGFIATALAPAGDAVNTFGEQFPIVQSLIDHAFGAYKSIVDNVLPVIQGFIADHGDEIVAVLKDAWEIIQLAINVALTFIDKYIVQNLKAAADFIGKNQEQVKQLFSDVWNAIRALLQIVFAVINGLLRVAMALMKGDTEAALLAIQTMFNDVWNGIKTFVGSVLSAIKNIIDLRLKEAGTSVDEVLTKIGAKFNEIWNGIKTATSSAFDSIKRSIVEPVQAALDALGKMVASFADIGRKIVEGIIGGIKALGQHIADTLAGFVQKAVDTALGVIAEVKAKVDALFGLIQKAKDAIGKVVFPPPPGNTVKSVNSTSNNTNYYNLTVAASASPAVVMQSFDVMKAFAP